MKAIRFILFLACLVLPVSADSVQSSLDTIQRNSALLASKARPEGVTLTWGQDLAAQDLERLAKAALAMKSEESDDILSLAPLVGELGTAATRVRSTASISALSEEGQALALATVDEVKLLQQLVSNARQVAEQRRERRNYYGYGPRVSFGIGFGSFYPYGYGGWSPYGYGGWNPYPFGGYSPWGGYRHCR